MDPPLFEDWLYSLLDNINDFGPGSSLDLLMRFGPRFVAASARHIKKLRRAWPQAEKPDGAPPISEAP